ncbi:MAG TPA: 1-acyl-sn-glycerol-3-phosphate acyltransferase [Brumimicrobium sp.]|nr:1-acyl-sn-glycerol-3-phosphate acyltransferase [Brumimicrobium sp.]
MRIFYFILKFLLKPTLWIYYPRFKILNKENKRFERTIYMCNHASSFMDPLVIGGLQSSIVFFMTRGDIYKGLVKPAFWGAHMLPIYRRHDKGDITAKNEESFKRVNKVLSFGRSLIIFAEGFTDDVFIRRLKPIKKGGVRMGFMALEEMNWSKKVYIQAVGYNYSDPQVLGSDCLISNGQSICLNNYKEHYLKAPSDTINKITKRMEIEMRKQITDVRNAEMAPFHENIMRITRKGMNAIDTDKSIPLEKRWRYSQRLANWFNENKVENNPELMSLKERLEKYFAGLKADGYTELAMYKVNYKERNKVIDLFYLIALFPIMVLGQALTYLPYRFIKNWVEKSFKRSVFWSSVKMLIGAVAVGVYNLILAFFAAKILGTSFVLMIVLGLILTPYTFVVARNWFKTYHLHKEMSKVYKADVSKHAYERDQIAQEIKRLIPDFE